MIKYRFLWLLALAFIFTFSCKKEDEKTPFDHAGQAVIDNDSLVKYMKNHFVDTEGKLQEITNNETAVYNQVTTQTVTRKWDDEEVEYKLYYLILESGTVDKPVNIDSVHVSYKGFLLNGNVFDQNDYGTWLVLSKAIQGWSYGIPHFRSGLVSVLPDTSFEFTDNGKGILFIPSGLGYANVHKSDIPASSPLIFYVELNMVNHVDNDRDTLLSMFEDLNANGDLTDDNTDEDSHPNYLDTDDDGDGTLTKNENPDPNGDGNPEDALDTDSDGVPDYLDPDNS